MPSCVIQPTVVQVEAPQTTVVHVGTPGLQGPPGPMGPAGSSVEVLTAAMPVSAFRCVSLLPDGRAALTDPLDDVSMQAIAGLSTSAAGAAGASINVGRGFIQNPAWSLAPNSPIFVGADGALTQSPPTAIVSRQVGIALSATSIHFNPLQPFFF